MLDITSDVTTGITTFISTYRYAALVPIAVVGGPIVAIFIGFLAANDVYNPFVAYTIFVLGDVIPDAIYYYIGRIGKQKNALEKVTKKLGLPGHHKAIKFLWFKHGRKTMFFAKLAYGLSTAILISAGLVKLPFKKFMSYAIPVTLGQYAICLALGYYFGQEYKALSKIISFTEYLLTGIILILIVGYFFMRKYLTKYIANLDVK